MVRASDYFNHVFYIFEKHNSYHSIGQEEGCIHCTKENLSMLLCEITGSRQRVRTKRGPRRPCSMDPPFWNGSMDTFLKQSKGEMNNKH